MKSVWEILLVPIVLAVLGCAGKPPPPLPPTQVVLTVAAAADLNPDLSGRPSPLVVRLYELKTPGTFTSSDFFTLYEKDGTVLANDMVAREEMLIKAGETRQLERTLGEATRHLGLLAAYRDLDQAVWRTTLAVPLHKTTVIKIDLQRAAVIARPVTN
jgi:type VI secretion system protein VasD